MAKKRIDQRVEGRRRGLFSPPSGTTLGKGDTEMTVVRPRMRLCLLVVLAAAIAQPAAAAICNVPSAPHPNIQAAVDDVGCTEIIIAAGTFSEAPVIARTLTLQGAGSGRTFVQGKIEVSAGTVQLNGLHIAADTEPLRAHSGAEVSGSDLEVVNGPFEPPFFADGFEDGTTDQWSSTIP